MSLARLRLRFSSILVIIVCVFVVIHDSYFHFERSRIERKRQNSSALRHWSIHYTPKYFFQDSSLRYVFDLEKIKHLVEPGKALMSDRATSYYAAAALPLYVRNVHKHHGLDNIPGVKQFLYKGHLCYKKDPYHKKQTKRYLKRDLYQARKNNWPILQYILINKDKQNINLRRDCLAVKSEEIIESISAIADMIYEGQYLNLYQLRKIE